MPIPIPLGAVCHGQRDAAVLAVRTYYYVVCLQQRPVGYRGLTACEIDPAELDAQSEQQIRYLRALRTSTEIGVLRSTAYRYRCPAKYRALRTITMQFWCLHTYVI